MLPCPCTPSTTSLSMPPPAVSRGGGDVVAIPDRHIGVLLQLLAHAGAVVSKDQLIESAWERAGGHRQQPRAGDLGIAARARRRPGRHPYIQTVPRQGYRFSGTVTRTTARASDDSLDALLAPHRAWIEGRAALETLEAEQIVPRARRLRGRAAQRAGSGVGARRSGQRLHHAIRDDPGRRITRHRRR